MTKSLEHALDKKGKCLRCAAEQRTRLEKRLSNGIKGSTQSPPATVEGTRAGVLNGGPKSESGGCKEQRSSGRHWVSSPWAGSSTPSQTRACAGRKALKGSIAVLPAPAAAGETAKTMTYGRNFQTATAYLRQRRASSRSTKEGARGRAPAKNESQRPTTISSFFYYDGAAPFSPTGRGSSRTHIHRCFSLSYLESRSSGCIKTHSQHFTLNSRPLGPAIGSLSLLPA